VQAIQPRAEFFTGMRTLGMPLAKQGKSTFNGPEGVMVLQYLVDRETAIAFDETLGNITPRSTTRTWDTVMSESGFTALD
jgi:hypothetical protein